MDFLGPLGYPAMEKNNKSYKNSVPSKDGSQRTIGATALGCQIRQSPKPDCICAVTATAALHLISIGLIYLVLSNAIYSEIGCPAAVDLINSPLLYQISSTYGIVSITRAVVSTAAPLLPAP